MIVICPDPVGSWSEQAPQVLNTTRRLDAKVEAWSDSKVSRWDKVWQHVLCYPTGRKEQEIPAG